MANPDLQSDTGAPSPPPRPLGLARDRRSACLVRSRRLSVGGTRGSTATTEAASGDPRRRRAVRTAGCRRRAVRATLCRRGGLRRRTASSSRGGLNRNMPMSLRLFWNSRHGHRPDKPHTVESAAGVHRTADAAPGPGGRRPCQLARSCRHRPAAVCPAEGCALTGASSHRTRVHPDSSVRPTAPALESARRRSSGDSARTAAGIDGLDGIGPS